jgi:hypothetical protein
VLYPPTRAVEHAVSLPGVRPRRLFPVLWPLWQVDTSAEVYAHQQYEIIDHFVVRCVAEGGIDDIDGIARFLSLPDGTVLRCLAYLRTIGHVVLDGRTVRLTELGAASARAGVRYVPTVSRQTILIDRQTGRPFPRAHYDGGGVTVLDTATVPEDRSPDRTRFLQVFSPFSYDPDVIGRLAADPGRAGYNLPSQLRGLRQEAVAEGFLPCYLIETADGRLLAYSGVPGHRDDFLERACEHTVLSHLIQAAGIGDAEQVWRKWLTESPAHRSGRLCQPEPGSWRVELAADAFGPPPRIPLTAVGGYRFRKHHFLQVWCVDAGLRRRALLERARGIATMPGVGSAAELQDRVDRLAAALDVPAVTVGDLRDHADRAGDARCVDRLDALASAQPSMS